MTRDERHARAVQAAGGVLREGHPHVHSDGSAREAIDAYLASMADQGDPLAFVDHARTAHAAAQTSYGDKCRWCGHQHDPEDGRCDAPAHVGLGNCPCPGEGLVVAHDTLAEECRNRGAWAEQYMAERDMLRDAAAQGDPLVRLSEVVDWLEAMPGQYESPVLADAIQHRFAPDPEDGER